MCEQCNCQSDGGCNCGCGCGCHSRGFERRFPTKAEKIAELEAYLSDLKNEVLAVEEHLADLRK